MEEGTTQPGPAHTCPASPDPWPSASSRWPTPGSHIASHRPALKGRRHQRYSTTVHPYLTTAHPHSGAQPLTVSWSPLRDNIQHCLDPSNYSAPEQPSDKIQYSYPIIICFFNYRILSRTWLSFSQWQCLFLSLDRSSLVDTCSRGGRWHRKGWWTCRGSLGWGTGGCS